jgi:hypothetical protein
VVTLSVICAATLAWASSVEKCWNGNTAMDGRADAWAEGLTVDRIVPL